MEVIALSLIVGALIARDQRQVRKHLFPPSLCASCKEPIVHRGGRGWVHKSDGKAERFVDMGPWSRTHIALPPMTTWETFND